ncbi:hypothetical protein HIM_11333 [Hirsutella minnesotensis 3608]|uniref:Uncharacterized protein n=1 Tax=Hirsutella minnesotensis 3608 TaxID=1043627 RepID=A0A0F8A1C0_9HYPO|nr:hypothetical protein HIM_11333 [Hirsutella minnesotensis 3608]
MASQSTVSQLSELVAAVENWVATKGDSSSQYTSDELIDLDALSARLATATSSIQRRTGSYKPPCRAEVWQASEELRNQARSAVKAVFRDGALRQPAVFRNNLVLIFAGPKASEFDSDQARTRKAATSIRCQQLRKLEADKIVAWAISYRATSWAVGCMGTETFDCLLGAIPFIDAPWPPAVLELLYKIQRYGLQESTDYNNFLSGKWKQRI